MFAGFGGERHTWVPETATVGEFVFFVSQTRDQPNGELNSWSVNWCKRPAAEVYRSSCLRREPSASFLRAGHGIRSERT